MARCCCINNRSVCACQVLLFLGLQLPANKACIVVGGDCGCWQQQPQSICCFVVCTPDTTHVGSAAAPSNKLWDLIGMGSLGRYHHGMLCTFFHILDSAPYCLQGSLLGVALAATLVYALVSVPMLYEFTMYMPRVAVHLPSSVPSSGIVCLDQLC
jgi:hypothetical protein